MFRGAKEMVADDEMGDEAFERDADGWGDLMDGKIRKRVITEGAGPNPEMQQIVECSVKVRLADAEADDWLQERSRVRYRIGESEAVPMLELALRHMHEGEVSEVFGVSNMAWGPAGCAAVGSAERPVPPSSDIHMLVVLHKCLEVPLGDLSWDDKLRDATWRKENGNDHFRRKSFSQAARCYAAGIDVFGGGFDPPDGHPSAGEAAAAATAVVCDCASNLAAVHLEKGDHAAARDAARAALERQPEHIKARYRLARASLVLGDLDECEACLKLVLAQEPENAGARSLTVELRRARKQYAAESKRLAAGFLAGARRPESDASPADEAEAEKPDAEDENKDDEDKGKPCQHEEGANGNSQRTPWGAVAMVVLLCAVAMVAALRLVPAQHLRLALGPIVFGAPFVLASLTAEGRAPRGESASTRARRILATRGDGNNGKGNKKD